MTYRSILFVTVSLLMSCSVFGAKKPATGVAERGVSPGSAPAGSEPARDAPLADPVSVSEHDITFESRGDTLRGTLHLPQNVEGQVPGVVIVHDAGPLNRSGIVSESFGVRLPVEIPLYESLAKSLASRGMAVLTYDKRTCVQGGPPWCTYDRQVLESHRDELGAALVDDARAARRALGAHEKVLAEKLFFVGHGQGADVALVAAEADGIDALVLLAPVAASPDAIVMQQTAMSIQLLEQQRAAAKNGSAAGLYEKQLQQLRAQRDKQDEVFRQIRAGENPQDSFGLSPPTWRSLFELHQRAMSAMSTVEAPILALVPDVDPGVPADDAERLEASITGAARGELIVVPDLTRLMVDVGEGKDPTVVSEQVVETILDFLDRA